MTWWRHFAISSGPPALAAKITSRFLARDAPPRHMSSDSFWTTKFATAALRRRLARLRLDAARRAAAVPRANGARPRAGAARVLAAARDGAGSRRATSTPACPICRRQTRARILTQHFESLGLSLVEMAMGWFGARDAVRAAHRHRRRRAPRGRAREGQGRHSVLGALHDVRVLLGGAARRCARSSAGCTSGSAIPS